MAEKKVAAVAEQAKGTAKDTKPRPRSPGYPGIDLETALKRAKTLYEKEGKHEASENTILHHWGYKPRSGPGLSTIAAIKAFGLLETNKKTYQHKLSDLALRIILDEREDQTERQAAIRGAALKPAMHQYIYQKFDGGVPSDANLLYHLRKEKGFTDGGATQFIAEYKATLAFAGLVGNGKLSDAGGDESRHEELPPMQTQNPPRSTPFPGANPPPPPAGPHKLAASGMNSDTFTLDEGQVVLQWPARISQESYTDLKDWLDLMARKVKRAVRAPEADEPAE